MASTLALSITIGATVSSAFNTALGSAARTLGRLGATATQIGVRQTQLGAQIAHAMTQPTANISALTRQYNRLGQTLQQVQARSDALGRSMARDAELGRQRGALRGQALETMGTAFALGAPVVGAVRQAGNFQADLRNTAITGGFAGTPQEAELGQVIRAEAVRTAQSTGVLNQAVGTLVAGGIQDVQALKAYVPVLGVAATAWNADMNDLSALALTTKDQFGVVAEDFKSVLNMLGTAGKEGQFEVKDMAKWMPALGAQLKGLGLAGKKGLAEGVAWLQVARMGAGSNDAAARLFAGIAKTLGTGLQTQSRASVEKDPVPKFFGNDFPKLNRTFDLDTFQR